MDVNSVSIAGLVFGVISFVGLLMYLVIVNFILPKYSSSVPLGDILFYASIVGMLIILPLNITYGSLAGSGKSSDQMNTAFIATVMVLLTIVNVLVGYSEYLKIGTSAAYTGQYLQILLPANLLISVIAVSIIIMKQIGHI